MTESFVATSDEEQSNQINVFINSSKEKKRNTAAKGMEGQKKT